MLQKTHVNEALERKCPEPIWWATCADDSGRPNAIVLGWAMSTSHKPPMIAISVGHTRYSHELIAKSKEFVAVIPSHEMTNATVLLGTRSGRQGDKMKAAGVKLLPASVVSAPLVDDACANFECKVVAELATGDHTIFVGEVLAAHAGPDTVRRIYTLCDGSFGPVKPF